LEIKIKKEKPRKKDFLLKSRLFLQVNKQKKEEKNDYSI
jgi:hypothetical protein